MTEKILKATHEGKLKIGKTIISCAVLEDGSRIISQTGLLKAFGRAQEGRKNNKGNLPVLLAPKNLRPFIDKDLMGRATSLITYKSPLSGHPTKGLEAKILPDICDVWLKARENKVLLPNQKRIAKKAEILVRGLARVGINALVDEATGYQDIRRKDALQALLDKYLLKEFATWAKRFPDEFYKEMFRLKNWDWNFIKRPSCVGNYTKDLIYNRLAPNILKELEKRNPKDEKGNRKGKHHQLLTLDIGHPALSQHLHAVIGLMRASSNWEGFYRLMQRAFPKRGDTLEFDFDKK